MKIKRRHNGLFVNQQWHTHLCVGCDCHLECYCEAPWSVVEYICGECQGEMKMKEKFHSC